MKKSDHHSHHHSEHNDITVICDSVCDVRAMRDIVCDVEVIRDALCNITVTCDHAVGDVKQKESVNTFSQCTKCYE